MAGASKGKGEWNKEPGKSYDATEKARSRGGDREAADEARKQESDEVNEETNLGVVSAPEGDSAGENRVSTSISDD